MKINHLAMTFEVLYEDDWLVAINKPSGIMVHPTGITEDTVFVLPLLSEQLGQPLFPVHRLDRGTSGVLIFGKSSEAASRVGLQLMSRSVSKKYLVVVRGWPPEEGTIDYPLAREVGKEKKEAITNFRKIAQAEIEAAIGLRYPTARFSLMEAEPLTGRLHQIRKHFAHLNYPVINCRHGDVKQNKYFRQVLGISRMLLHAHRLELAHPETGEMLRFSAPFDAEFSKALEICGLSNGASAAGH